ncbi:Drug/Metabolite transporter (DMT) Superfamily [Phytophthora cinnamomi]|uniref:Drug/Metabolite transporter (DMT) Superfamily n=1 Tax=Phytophthora cinnamomi TaxID=4785 RepID=UPI00355995C2|nr:Drug/Metabolite transporter (DMT) Superfamily [Phytophthora cinnamomi]
MAVPAAAAAAPAKQAAPSSAWVGYVAMVLLAMQFGLQPILYKEFAGEVKNRSVLVIACEGCKLLLSLLTLLSSGALGRVVKTWNLHDSLMASGLPACTYAVQNVLIQVAYQHLPSIVFNLINQTKLLSAALFLYFLMGTRFSLQQCFAMMMLLGAAVLLSLAKDGGADDSAAPAISVELGLVPVLLASLLSGLGSALTQRSMQQHKRDAALVTMELSIYGSLFLMLPAIWSTIVKTPVSESPAANALANMDKVFEGCTYYTIIPVVSNALGGLLVGTVTKYVGGVLKSFALICGIAFTAFVESYVYGAVLPNEVFIAAGLVATSMAIYSSFPYAKKEVKAKTE